MEESRDVGREEEGGSEGWITKLEHDYTWKSSEMGERNGGEVVH